MPLPSRWGEIAQASRKEEISEDYPFDSIADPGKWTVMRHRANKKSFALIYERNGKLCVNLKCDPLEANLLRQAFADVMPGYHMNKTHWNTVTLGGDVPDEMLHDMIGNSYDLIKPKTRRKEESPMAAPMEKSKMDNAFTAKVSLFERDKGWHYVSVPTDLSKPLVHLADRGLIAVTARIGSSSWQTSLLPMGDGTHFIPLPAKVRRKEGLAVGSVVEVSFEIR
jgi:predicted DNA-binding protein (MmcQ/YjbR family)